MGSRHCVQYGMLTDKTACAGTHHRLLRDSTAAGQCCDALKAPLAQGCLHTWRHMSSHAKLVLSAAGLGFCSQTSAATEVFRLLLSVQEFCVWDDGRATQHGVVWVQCKLTAVP